MVYHLTDYILIIVTMVDPEAIKKEWKEIFSTMDQDQSGSITCNELYKFIVKVVLHSLFI